MNDNKIDQLNLFGSDTLSAESSSKKKRMPLTQFLTKEILQDLYLVKGRSLEDIARQFNCARTTIQIIMKKHGIARRNRSQARVLAIKHKKFEKFDYYDIDETFFKSWSPAMAWVLGLLFTDGYIQQRGSRLKVGLASIDSELLEKVRAQLKSKWPIVKRAQSYDKTKFLYIFEFYRERMREDLISLGLHQKKSLTIQFPQVPDDFMRHFIRGCWDGDGSFFLSKGKLWASYVSGSKAFIQKLVDELYKAGIYRKFIRVDSTRTLRAKYPDRQYRFALKKRLKEARILRAKYPAHQYPLKIHGDNRPKAKCYSIKTSSRENLLKIYNYFYNGVEESLFLKRKHDVFAKGLGLLK